MSRYIDADALDRAFSKLRFNNDGELEHYGDRPNWYLWGSEVENLIADAPSIDLADYVPKDFHDKTCEAMAKAHQEEIADMVSVVRCKECRYCKRKKGTFKGEPIIFYRCEENNRDVENDDYCSFGEREGE